MQYIKAGEATPTGCLGNAAEPGAEPGNLCVFAETEEGSVSKVALTPGVQVHNALGFIVRGIAIEEGLAKLNGSWAVTAE